MRASAEGLFQEFNDVAASLNRIAYLDDDGEQVHALPAAASDQLVDFDVSLDDCLSRTVSAVHCQGTVRGKGAMSAFSNNWDAALGIFDRGCLHSGVRTEKS